MAQIPLCPGKVINTLSSLFKDRYTTRTEQQTNGNILCISNCVKKCVTGKEGQCTQSALLWCVLFVMCSLSNAQIYAIPSLESLYRSYR